MTNRVISDLKVKNEPCPLTIIWLAGKASMTAPAALDRE